MERASAFTAVPGWGTVLVGFTAIVAAVVASRAPGRTEWVAVWLLEAAVALAIAVPRSSTRPGAPRSRSSPARG